MEGESIWRFIDTLLKQSENNGTTPKEEYKDFGSYVGDMGIGITCPHCKKVFPLELKIDVGLDTCLCPICKERINL